MLEVLMLLTERMAIIVTVAFILTRTQAFKRTIDLKLNNKTKIILSFIFGGFGILGTYAGIPVSSSQSFLLWVPGVNQLYFDYALANLRTVGVVTGGLLGGPLVGFGAGLIAGGHRLLLGGFTALACGLSPMFEGIISGLISKKFEKGRIVSAQIAFLTGFFMTIIHLTFILFLSQPYAKALDLVEVISFPMIIDNSIGAALFIAIIKTLIQEEDRIEANQAQKILHIADTMLFHLQQGLNHRSARELIKIIYHATQVSAISITDHEKILAHIGVGSDHHIPGNVILTKATEEAIHSGELSIVKSKEEIDCNYPYCTLAAAIICPYKKGNEVMGVLKFYFLDPKQIKPVDIKLAEGLGKLLSHQLEVAEAQKQSKLISLAEIKALQAQINPHFLFNSLNTVIALIRTNPDVARDLLVQLGSFFRQNLNTSQNELVTLQQEIEHTQAYLNIEQVRFHDRLTINFNVDSGLEKVLIPPLTLQPLVENALKHGLKDIPAGGVITIELQNALDKVKVTIRDNGIGIPAYKINNLINPKNFSVQTGLGLNNVNQRLIGYFGSKAGLKIENCPEGGTKVYFELPFTKGDGDARQDINSR
ncbi:MAG: histidine kinase [Peptococcaceae bacterium]|nr:histidine kinase [Peptococcaceae bacterium]